MGSEYDNEHRHTIVTYRIVCCTGCDTLVHFECVIRAVARVAHSNKSFGRGTGLCVGEYTHIVACARAGNCMRTPNSHQSVSITSIRFVFNVFSRIKFNVAQFRFDNHVDTLTRT